MKRRFIYLMTLAFIGLPLTGYAQDGTDEDTSSTDDDAETPLILEEVMVTGIRSSLLNAVDIKRSNVGTMEAISTEDFGKFPDGNLAESLARVPGIAIDLSLIHI